MKAGRVVELMDAAPSSATRRADVLRETIALETAD